MSSLCRHNESYKHKDASRQAEKVIRSQNCSPIVICFKEIQISKNASLPSLGIYPIDLKAYLFHWQCQPKLGSRLLSSNWATRENSYAFIWLQVQPVSTDNQVANVHYSYTQLWLADFANKPQQEHFLSAFLSKFFRLTQHIKMLLLKHIIASIVCTSTVPSGKPNLFCTTEVSSRILLPFSPNTFCVRVARIMISVLVGVTRTSTPL